MADNKLNNELLQKKEEEKDASPKRNSKQELIQKIITVAKDNEIPLELSDTKLQRMTKQQLSELLGETVEKAMRNEMARQVGARPGAADSVIALGALRMMHDIAARGAEKCFNAVLPGYGYEVEGFADSLQEPSVRQATDACLAEIAQDSDILQYVQSPWSRLAIAWGGALVTSIQRKRVRYTRRRQYYAPRVESECADGKDTGSEHRPNRREADGQEHGDGGPPVAKCKKV